MKKKLSKLITTIFISSIWISAGFAVAKHMQQEDISFNKAGYSLPSHTIT